MPIEKQKSLSRYTMLRSELCTSVLLCCVIIIVELECDSLCMQLYITSFDGESRKELVTTVQGYQNWDVRKPLYGNVYVLDSYTVEPPNKGHLGTRASVLYSEVSFIRRLEMYCTIGK